MLPGATVEVSSESRLESAADRRRTAAPERARKHVAGSLHFPLGRLSERLGELPRDRPVIVYCAGGYRSSIVASVLQRSGRTAVGEIPGGIGAWEQAGLPVAANHELDFVHN